jgi:hypothetical protein
MWFYNQPTGNNFDLASYVAAHPTDDVAKYYLASNLWKEGKLDEARNIVKNLIASHPDLNRYKSTWSKIANSNDASEHPFQIDIPMLKEGW